MNWGKWIIFSFVSFAVFIGVLVTICVREDISLVTKNYYQEELAYQQQITRLNNTSRLDVKPSMAVVGHVLEVQFNQFHKIEHGEVKLFRPSDVRLDKRFMLQSSLKDSQEFDLSTLPKGMYRAKMKWTMDGKEYYLETMINL